MRKVLLLVMLAVAVVAPAQTAPKLLSPTTINVPVTGTQASLRVFYSAPEGLNPVLTDVGRLVATKQVIWTPADPQSNPRSGVLSVLLSEPLKPGETHTGALVFTPATGDPVSFAVTVTRPQMSFTAAALQTDICLACGEPRVVSVQITNSGAVILEKIEVGTVVMADANRRHRTILPRGPRDCGKPQAAEPKTRAGDGKIVVAPCGEAELNLAPGQSRVISVVIEPPDFAGDYTTTIELYAFGSPAVSVAPVVHIRGPRGQTWWPAGLFLLTVLGGFIVAQAFEYWFGSGGGAQRNEALIALNDIYAQLETLHTDLEHDLALPITLRHVKDDLGALKLVLDQGKRRPLAQLQTDVAGFALRLDKRLVLLQKADLVRNDRDKLERLDNAPVTGDLAAYADLLDGIVKGETTVTEVAAKASPHGAAEAKRLNARRRMFRVWRTAILALLALGTAYGMFYANGCNFGSLGDYFQVLLWALGLTAAGNTITTEVVSRYVPPVAAPPGAVIP